MAAAVGRLLLAAGTAGEADAEAVGGEAGEGLGGGDGGLKGGDGGGGRGGGRGGGAGGAYSLRGHAYRMKYALQRACA